MVDKQLALKLWKYDMQDKEYAYNFSGKKIKKTEYLENNRVGWVVTYVKPLSYGGPDNESNMVIMHQETYLERGDKYPIFNVVGKEYEAKYDERNDFYYIERVISDDDDGGFFL